VLRGMFGQERQERDEVTGGWRKLHNEQLHNLYCTPNIIRVARPRRIITAHVREEKCIQNFN
jgi:hypothetical protein